MYREHPGDEVGAPLGSSCLTRPKNEARIRENNRRNARRTDRDDERSELDSGPLNIRSP